MVRGCVAGVKGRNRHDAGSGTTTACRRISFRCSWRGTAAVSRAAVRCGVPGQVDRVVLGNLVDLAGPVVLVV